ncbi:hypothetical protein MINTMi27_15400 [Mycobacterium intracellulare]|nr:hypothetical protein MINTMi27_15400 [Mycobacterium intracellulare]
MINLGRFSDLEEATQAREDAERKYFTRSTRFGDIGTNPRRIEVIPATKPVRQPMPEPSPAPAPVKTPEPEKVPV